MTRYHDHQRLVVKPQLSLLGAILIALAAGCASQPPYFPDKIFSNDLRRQRFVAAWYSEHLFALGETPLPPQARDQANHLYRFTCLRTFQAPFCVVLTVKPKGSGRVLTKITTGKGGYATGVLADRSLSLVSKRQVDDFLALLEAEHYWRLEPVEPPGGADGSQWIIEAVRDGRYHLVDRWSPDETSPAGKIGRRLLEMAKFRARGLRHRVPPSAPPRRSGAGSRAASRFS